MKTLHQIQRTLFILLLITAATSCKKHRDNPIDQTKKVTVQLSGANEVPAVPTTGTGTAAISYDLVTKMITYTLTWQLGSVTSTTTDMHFHGAEDGSDTKSSPIIIGITGFTTSYSGTISSTTRALTSTEEAQLLAGKWYVNVHSSIYPTGEIRGNIKFP